jgi:hypothetical protein
MEVILGEGHGCRQLNTGPAAYLTDFQLPCALASTTALPQRLSQRERSRLGPVTGSVPAAALLTFLLRPILPSACRRSLRLRVALQDGSAVA